MTDLSLYDLSVRYGESVTVYCRRCRDPYYKVGDYPLPIDEPVCDVQDALDIAKRHEAEVHGKDHYPT